MLRSFVATRIGQLAVAPLRRVRAAVRPNPVARTRWRIARKYLRGTGIEIGALHNPLRLPASATARYVDRMPVDELRRQYPDLADKPLVPVDIVSDGETLSGVPDDSQAFVIANHFLEHCEDPIGTVKNCLRVLAPGGVLYMAVPDKRFTFDRDRPITSLGHLIDDHLFGPEASRRGHYEEYARFVHGRDTEASIREMADHLIERQYSIHFHVWTRNEIHDLITWVQAGEPVDIELVTQNGHEVVCVLRKHRA